MAERIDTLTTPPVVGRAYMVPTVRYTLAHAIGFEDREWPVIGPRHNDKALGFEVFHYHFDVRFFSPAQEELAQRLGTAMLDRDADAFLPGADWLDAFNGSVQLLEAPECRMPAREWKRRVCIRSTFRTMVDLSRPQFAPIHRYNRKIRRRNGRIICPHLKADISSCPVVDGRVHCPIHGLWLEVQG